jgi:excisionase family DNA binding protein
MMENLDFNSLPQVVFHLNEKVDVILKLLSEQMQKSEEPKDRLMNIQEAAEFLNLSIATIYSFVSKGVIPCMKKTKRLYFSTQELTTWLKSGRKMNDAA